MIDQPHPLIELLIDLHDVDQSGLSIEKRGTEFKKVGGKVRLPFQSTFKLNIVAS